MDEDDDCDDDGDWSWWLWLTTVALCVDCVLRWLTTWHGFGLVVVLGAMPPVCGERDDARSATRGGLENGPWNSGGSKKKFPKSGKITPVLVVIALSSSVENGQPYNFSCPKKKKTHTMTKKEKALHDKAVEYFKSIGIWEKGMVLHHMDPNLKYTDPGRYHEWRVEDLKPLTKQEHRSFHMKLQIPKGSKKSATQIANMRKGHNNERRKCHVMIHRVVDADGIHGIESYVFRTCAEAAKHIGCSLQLVYQTASGTQHNRRAKGWFCDYVPRSVDLGRVAGEAFDKVRALVA